MYNIRIYNFELNFKYIYKYVIILWKIEKNSMILLDLMLGYKWKKLLKNIINFNIHDRILLFLSFRNKKYL